MRLLLIARHAPVPAVNGGNQRTNLLYRALAQAARVDLLILSDPESDPGVAATLVRDFGLVAARPVPPAGARPPWSAVRTLAPRLVDRFAHNFGSRRRDYTPVPELASLVRRHHREVGYDAIVSRYLGCAARCGAFEIAPVLVDVDDVDTEVYRSRLTSPTAGSLERVVVARHLVQVERLFPAQIRRAQHVWVASEPDRPLVQHPSVSVLPNIPFHLPGAVVPERDSGPPTFVTVASYSHTANVRGIEHFLGRIWPDIRARLPDARYVLAGSALDPRRRKRWATVPGVEIVGPFDDVAPVYAACTVAVVPVFEGGGTKIKIPEALGHGRCVVAPRHALRGYESTLACGARTTDGDPGFAAACIELATQPEVRRALAARGRAAVERHYTFAAFAEQVHGPLARVVGGARDRRASTAS